MVKGSDSSKDYRSFSIAGSAIGYDGSRFISETPAGAANKAAKRLFQLARKDPEFKHFKSATSIKFILIEATRGSGEKTYFYDGYRKPLPKPHVQREFPNPKDPDNPIVVTYTHKIVVRAGMEHDFRHIVNARA